MLSTYIYIGINNIDGYQTQRYVPNFSVLILNIINLKLQILFANSINNTFEVNI